MLLGKSFTKSSQISEGETRIVVPVMKALGSRDFLSPKQWDNAQLKRFLAHKKVAQRVTFFILDN